MDLKRRIGLTKKNRDLVKCSAPSSSLWGLRERRTGKSVVLVTPALAWIRIVRDSK